MAVIKRPVHANEEQNPVAEDFAEKFIGKAPDAAQKPRKTRVKGALRTPVVKGNREQISITVPLDLVQRLEAARATLGLTRAGLINIAIADFLKARGFE